VHVLRKDLDTFGRPLPGAPHAVTVRTPDARLIWYAPIHARSSKAIEGLQVLVGWRGILVRDDYAGWQQFDTDLAGVQQCAASSAPARASLPSAGLASRAGPKR
jgi:hypothetical protein